MVSQGCFYVGVSLCKLCEYGIFGVTAVFGLDASHIFSQSVLVSIPLIGGVIGVVVTRACTRCWVGLPLCSVAVIALLRVRSAPWLLE